jgi:putative tryptophan/tyrosine transport system substrate-binding protein
VAVTEKLTRDTEAGARSLGLEIHVFRASTERDLNEVFVRLADTPGRPLVIGADAFLVSQSETLARLGLLTAVSVLGIEIANDSPSAVLNSTT